MACANGTPSSSSYSSTAANGSNGSGSGGNGGNGGNGGTATGGGFNTTSSGKDAGAEKCDDAGHCTCVTIASLGYEGVWGPCSGDSTTAFQTWLNTQSTAHVDSYEQHPMGGLTDEFLSEYNILILQWMVDPVTVSTTASGGTSSVTEGNPWTFTSAELTAVQKWVNNGGGIIALTGYNCQDSSSGCTVKDNVATNQLLGSFTDLTFNSDNTLNGSPDNMSSLCAPEDCYCWGSSLPLGQATQAIANPLAPATATSMGLAVGTWDQTTVIGAHVTDIGAFNGRSIAVKSPSAGTVVVDASDSSHTYSAHEDIGKGHVAVYGDEWLTYTGEWTGSSKCQMWDYDSGSCAGKNASEVFQIPQFWYNTIKYAASAVTCFTISTPGIVY